MELITILNRCHRLRGFIYEHAHFSADKKSIELAVRPHVMRSRIEPMKKIARSLRQHRELILN